jgi:hypothetical protein
MPRHTSFEVLGVVVARELAPIAISIIIIDAKVIALLNAKIVFNYCQCVRHVCKAM